MRELSGKLKTHRTHRALAATRTAHHLPRCRGMTLIELLAVLSIVAISAQLFGITFQSALANMRSASAMRHIASIMALARHEAILRRRPVTVCAVDATDRCQRDWQKNHRITAFIDDNENRRYEPGEVKLREITWPLQDGTLSWRASLARPYLEFEETGATWQNGTLFYCPASRDARQARALVISQSGRNYLPGDTNGDGIREDRTGRNLRC